MTAGQWILAILIHLVTPLTRGGAYVWLCQKMHRERVPEPPYLCYFMLFFNYGGYLLVVLTMLWWRVSGMFLAGFVYLVTLAPIASWVVAALLRKRTALSRYHQMAFRLGLAFPMLVLASVGCLYWGTAFWAASP